MLDVRRLRLLRDLARLGTIAAVARAHAYTASAVSQQLAALQREAGVPLLEHTGRGVTLTPAATALVRHAETILAALEAATATLAAARTGLSGAVRIGAFPSAVPTLLPAALVALGRDHPALDLMVTELDPVDMPDALRDGRLDVALWHDYDIAPVESDPGVDSVRLLDEKVFLAVPADGPPDDRPGGRPGGRPDDAIASTRDAAWIVGSPGTLCHTVAMRVCQAAGFTAGVRHHADDFTAVLALVAAGQGVALVPELGATRPPADVRLVPLDVHRRTRIAYRRGAGGHPVVAACVAALESSTRAYLAPPAQE
ncbi:LysR family transcriptional regulator [Saccharothrix texasensis]|uniref:DNA-binding transcriptional LysR family regulator n=1 Tax=Saccharothrix texasensis TaxID=103734 RepID=A0A3N1HCM7_9PSEU|nr:LysR family transcriptional regulator [Saccharothrix texasensis]ROP40257.1 DNA-binding transcriptional LysR family regulator [Saccharothrix texasensis]